MALFHLFLNISKHCDSVNLFYRRMKLIYSKGQGHDISLTKIERNRPKKFLLVNSKSTP